LTDGERIGARFDGDILETAFLSPAVIPTRFGGRSAFCNSWLIYHFHQDTGFFAQLGITLTTEEDRPLAASLTERLAREADARTVEVKWETGDILVVDNSRFMHGRRAIRDDARLIHVRMGRVHQRWVQSDG
jgi:Taurine catabolism dioxygenase TauD, TfdA family